MICSMYMSLEDWYRTSWAMKNYHNYSLTDIHEMLPYERDLYNTMTIIKQQENKDESGI